MGCCQTAGAVDPGAKQPLAHGPQEVGPEPQAPPVVHKEPEPQEPLEPQEPIILPDPESVDDWIAEAVAAHRAAVEEFGRWNDNHYSKTDKVGTDSSRLPRLGMEAWYKAEDCDIVTKTWKSCINTYVARVTAGQLAFLEEVGHGAKIHVKAVSGDTGTVCDFGHIIKGAFTCASVCRYLPGAHARILQGCRSNWLHSHWGNQTGVAHYDGWMTAHQRNAGSEDWVVFIGQNGGSNIKRADGLNVSTNNGGSGDQQLVTNAGKHPNEKSNFAILELITWNRHLSLTEILQVEKYLQRRLGQFFSIEAERAMNEVARAGLANRRLQHFIQNVDKTIQTKIEEARHAYMSCRADFVKMCNERELYTVENAEVAIRDAEAKLWANMIEKVVAKGETERAARLHAVPLKVLEKAAVDAEVVRKIVIPRDLPTELEHLQLLHGDADRISCLFCKSQDTAAVDAVQDDPTKVDAVRDGPRTMDAVWKAASSPVLARVSSEPLPMISKRFGAKVDLARCTSQPFPAMSKRLDVCESNRKMLKGGVDGVLWLFETKGGGWDTYRPHMAKILEQAFLDGPGALVQIKGGRFDYLVDIAHMTQRNAETGTERRLLRIIPSPDGGIELPPPLAAAALKRQSCRYGSNCFRKNPDHKKHFAHPGDEDYVDVEADVPEEPAWFYQSDGGDATPIDKVTARQLESLRTSRLASLDVIIRVLSASACLRVNLESMTARSESGQIYTITRLSSLSHDDEEILDNSVPEEPPVSSGAPPPPSVTTSDEKIATETQICQVCHGVPEDPRVLSVASPPVTTIEAKLATEAQICQVCNGTGEMSKWLSEADVTAAIEMRTSEQLEAYDCSICYGEGQYALSAACGKHFFCADCIESSLDAILASGQFPAVCPMCRAEAMGVADASIGGIGEAELSFLQTRDVISLELLFRFLRQMRQSGATEGEAKYFACPAKCGRFLLEADPCYHAEPGSLFSLGFWDDDKFIGTDKQHVRLGACACGYYVCVRCNRAEQLAAAHECTQFQAADDSLEAIEPLLKANIAKRCPNCPALIIKNEGCNFMTCTACKDPRGFCWQTGKPRHGPCPPCCGGGHNCH